MKILKSLGLWAWLLTWCLSPQPGWAVSKEMIQLQTQVQALQDQMTRMQQSFDERMGVMKNLLDQNSDSMNKAVAAMTALQGSLEKLQNDNGGRVDQLSGQIQALNDSLDELKARLAKVSKQLEDLQATQQNQAATTAAQQAQQQALAQAPPPDVLYNNALRDYNGGKNDLAKQEFSDYIKFYPTTDLAGNTYFYLAELAFKQGDYQGAISNYDQVLQNFPSGNKAASADLKKGLALIELGQKDDGIAELRHVIQRYPRSNEAAQARDRLHKLGVSTSATTAKRQS
ncbi:MAG TPA: tetratricopeptide repeat protein [Terriglobales bacterium]|nr:tetratricopeptide repeat protein [Terriglobales bacterium]